MANIKGGNKNDILFGTAAADRIQGMGGNDRLSGLGGNDLLEGGTGDDWLQGGAGSDNIDGGTGTDTADYSDNTGGIRLNLGAHATDTRGNGTVREYDAAGNLASTDTLTSIENVTGGSGNDQLFGNYAFNILHGGDGRDFIFGGGGSDRIYGDGGDDLLAPGAGNTFIDGGAGTDTLFWYTGSGADTFVDLQAGTVSYATNATVETLVSIENARSHGDDDTISGSSVANALQGGGGNDVLDGRDGDDFLIGDYGRRLSDTPAIPAPGQADDVLSGGGGDDVLVGDFGDDILSGGSGSDRFEFDIGSGHDRITDFESGVDSIALFGGLSIAGWELRDSDGDGSADSQTAILSDGSTIMFVGHAGVPELSLASSTEALAYIDLATWL